MKDGTLYAGKLKRAFAKARQAASSMPADEPTDPIRQLALSILGEDCGEEESAKALDRLFATMVDFNELRVSTPDQVHRALGSRIPDGLERSRQLIRALQRLYEHEHRLSLERLKNMGRREARQFLESLEGVNDYSAAAVMLWSFGGHAIPVNNALLKALRDAELVHPTATRPEVQAFLERNIPAAQAKEFCLAMRGFNAAKRAAAPAAKSAKSAGKKEKTAPR
jgi:endonuclease III